MAGSSHNLFVWCAAHAVPRRSATAGELRRGLRKGGATAADSPKSPRSREARPPVQAKRSQAFQVEEHDRELLIRVRLDAGSGADSIGPAMVTQQNCEQIGLKRRQFIDLIRAGIIKGGRLPGTKIIAAKVEDVLRVVEQASAAVEQQETTSNLDDVEEVLAAVGMQRRRGSR